VAPVGRFRQLTEISVAEDESVTGKLAADPGETAAVGFANEGGTDPAVSTSNCITFETLADV
jgi:hypothetical protein